MFAFACVFCITTIMLILTRNEIDNIYKHIMKMSIIIDLKFSFINFFLFISCIIKKKHDRFKFNSDILKDEVNKKKY